MSTGGVKKYNLAGKVQWPNFQDGPPEHGNVLHQYRVTLEWAGIAQQFVRTAPDWLRNLSDLVLALELPEKKDDRTARTRACYDVWRRARAYYEEHVGQRPNIPLIASPHAGELRRDMMVIQTATNILRATAHVKSLVAKAERRLNAYRNFYSDLLTAKMKGRFANLQRPETPFDVLTGPVEPLGPMVIHYTVSARSPKLTNEIMVRAVLTVMEDRGIREITPDNMESVMSSAREVAASMKMRDPGVKINVHDAQAGDQTYGRSGLGWMDLPGRGPMDESNDDI